MTENLNEPVIPDAGCAGLTSAGDERSMEAAGVSAAEAANYIAPLNEYAGNRKIVEHFLACLSRPLGTEANVLIEGLPGTGKTTSIYSFLRDRFNNPHFMTDDVSIARANRRGEMLSAEEIRQWQTVDGKIVKYIRIEGEKDTPVQLERKINEILYNPHDFAYVLLDEAGQLFFRGYEEQMRSVLTEPGVVTFATAQDFRSKRRSDTEIETQDRLSAFKRRFPNHFTTEPPTDAEMIRLLIGRIKAWGIWVDSPETIRIIVMKARGVVGHALRPLISILQRSDRRLTRDFVLEYPVDPNEGDR